MVLRKEPVSQCRGLKGFVRTMMYDTMNFMNVVSLNDPTRRELSDKLTSALKASCAVA